MIGVVISKLFFTFGCSLHWVSKAASRDTQAYTSPKTGGFPWNCPGLLRLHGP